MFHSNTDIKYTYNFIQRLKNISASLVLILAISCFYASIPYFQRYFSDSTPFLDTTFVHWQVLIVTTISYSFILFIFYLTEKKPVVSKSILCLYALKRFVNSPLTSWKIRLPAEERLGLLSILLKAFFAPLMIVWLFSHTGHMLNHGSELQAALKEPEIDWMLLFNTNGFWFLFKLILFLDVFFFAIGYLIELPTLKNEIRSIDSTFLGWAVALASYPPFNGLTAMIFGGGYAADFPQFAHPTLHLAANIFILLLMAVYASASVALNFKASNLTHRGIISHGPYRFIRHPAYACKNLAWWIGLVPALIIATDTSTTAILITIGSMLGWSIIYLMRALTEEDHLRSVDEAYDQYCKKVKYRFIPGVI